MRLPVILLLSLLPTAALADVPRVVTDFGPIQSLVMEVMGDVGTPVMLLPSRGDPHDFQMKPSQADQLAKADVIFWDGPELMPALTDAMGTLAPNATKVALLHDGGGHIRQFADGEGTDPHAWLDPTNGIAWTGTIAAQLAAKDPEHAAIYAANAARVQATLKTLDADLTAEFAPVKDKPFVVYHDALGYFGDHFGLNIAGAIELSDASSPSAARLTEIQTILQTTKAICVFPEIGRDPKFIASLSGGLDIRVGTPQDVEFIALPAGPGQYEVMLRALAKSITDCLKQD
jgi:zinc transport system substrate-binding protein